MNLFARLSENERLDYFVETGQRMGLSPQMVEKDFWVCWVLEKLFSLDDVGPTLIFKGGTSLSKAYSLIERFSEDVDLSIDRASLGFAGTDCDPEADIGSNERKRRIERLREACQTRIVDHLMPALASVVTTSLGTTEGWG